MKTYDQLEDENDTLRKQVQTLAEQLTKALEAMTGKETHDQD